MDKTAWVISGGGAGIVHAFKSIEQHRAKGNPWPDFMVGTSAGGLLAILLCHKGLHGAKEELKKIKKRSQVFSTQANIHKGLWSHKPLQRLIAKTIKTNPFIPYWVCAYDIAEQKKIYFKHSDGWHHMAATACIPVLVNPVDGIYIDGGVVENKPLSYAIQNGATKIELFNCFARESPTKASPPKTAIGIAARSIEAMRIECAKNDVKICRLKNKLDGYRPIEVNEHYPERNLLDVLDFDKISDLLE